MKDPQITDTIRRLFTAEKPDDITPTALLLTIRLLVQHADEKDLNLSLGRLAEELNCNSENTIRAAVDILKRLDWLAVRQRSRQQMPNAYYLNLEKLPEGEDLRNTVISEWAMRAAVWYRDMIRAANPKRRFHKTTLQRFAFTLQWIKDKLAGGDVNRMNQVLSFALRSLKYRNEVMRGPHRLRHYWRSIVFDMENGAQK